MTDNNNIYNLLERFFEGDTTYAEERVLYDFFSGDNVPEPLKQYIPMFKWYAGGMKGEPGSELNVNTEKKKSSRTIKPAIWISSVAAAIAVIFISGWNYHFNKAEQELLAKQYEGSYMMVNGVMLTDMEDISAEIEALNLEAERIELELKAAELEMAAETEEFTS